MHRDMHKNLDSIVRQFRGNLRQRQPASGSRALDIAEKLHLNVYKNLIGLDQVLGDLDVAALGDLLWDIHLVLVDSADLAERLVGVGEDLDAWHAMTMRIAASAEAPRWVGAWYSHKACIALGAFTMIGLLHGLLLPYLKAGRL